VKNNLLFFTHYLEVGQTIKKMPKTGRKDQLSAFRNGLLSMVRNFISGRKGKLILVKI
jgi:hypothetical protein